MTDENAAEAPKRARRMAAEESDAVVSHDDTPQRASRFAAEPDESEAPSTTPEEPIHEHDPSQEQDYHGDHEHSPWRRPDPHSTTPAAPSSPAQPTGTGLGQGSSGGLAASSSTPDQAPSFAAPTSASASDQTPAAPTAPLEADHDEAEDRGHDLGSKEEAPDDEGRTPQREHEEPHDDHGRPGRGQQAAHGLRLARRPGRSSGGDLQIVWRSAGFPKLLGCPSI